jgi:hypothetical protein
MVLFLNSNSSNKHWPEMIYRFAIYTSMLLFCLVLFTTSQAQAGSFSPYNLNGSLAAGTVSIDPVPDSAPGDHVRYRLEFPVNLLSISFAWGNVTFTGAKTETLTLQFIILLPGDYSFTWDSIVPAGATGTATVSINYFVFPGATSSQTATYQIIQGTEPVQEYVGSSRCMSCHKGFTPDVVNAYTQTGHFYALSPISGKAPSFPSFAPGVPGPPPGRSWRDIAYVIGGFAWAANFASADKGTILTGPETQYNIASSYLGTSAGFTTYSPGTSNPGSFDCGTCHATGYSPDGHQGGLSDISGTWVENGVGCEACHGPGSAHVYNPYAVKPEITSASACADCHVRGSASTVAATDGLLLHQQQAAELQASPKSFMQCTTCHNPHASAHYDEQAAGTAIVADCTSCHAGIKIGLNMSFLACIDCHMPHAVNAGQSITFTDPSSTVYTLGNMRSHIFKINADALSPADMFTGDGKQLALDTTGKTSGLTLNFVCLGCHRAGGSAATSYTFDQVKNLATLVHSE